MRMRVGAMVTCTCTCTTPLLLLLLLLVLLLPPPLLPAHLMWCLGTALHTPAWHRRAL